jgi:hypothetical protein
MTGVERPPAAEETERHCPRCGAGLAEDQEWCLHCGAAVGTRVVAAPGWRIPLIVVGVLLVVIVAAIAIAIVELADDTEPVPTATATASPTTAPVTPGTTPTPVPTTAPATTPTPAPTEGEATPGPGATPSATQGGAQTGGVATWPAGTSGWTVIVASETSQSAAQAKAQSLVDSGASGVGVLHSDDFSSLRPGYWVVYQGRYDTQQQATDALAGVTTPDAYVRQITPG